MTGAFTWLYRTMGLEPIRERRSREAESHTSPTPKQEREWLKAQRAMQQYIRNRNDAKYQADLERRSGCDDAE